jgi:hypothetical protein
MATPLILAYSPLQHSRDVLSRPQTISGHCFAAILNK